MTPDELRDELAGGTLRPAYLVAGAEPLLRQEACGAIQSAALADGPSDFDLDRLDAARATPAELRDALATLPVLAPRRLVLLREPEGSKAPARALTDALPDLVAGLEGDGHAVLVLVAARVDARARWVKAFGGGRVVCDAPRRAREVVEFVRAEARRQGLKLDRPAAELLAERIGPQLMLLRQELAKAALMAGEDAKVTRAHVSAGTPDVAEEPVWDLTDAIGEGRTGDALSVLAKLRGGSAPPPLLLAAVASHFRRLLRVQAGGSVSAPPFVRRKLEDQAQRYGRRRLLACLAAIHRTDLALKGEGSLRPELALERLVIGLTG